MAFTPRAYRKGDLVEIAATPGEEVDLLFDGWVPDDELPVPAVDPHRHVEVGELNSLVDISVDESALGETGAVSNTLVRRNASGAAAFAALSLSNAPQLPDSATRKDYVDNIGTPNIVGETVVRRDLDGTASLNALNLAGQAEPQHAARKDYVDALGTSAPTGDTVARRNADGSIAFNEVVLSGTSSSSAAARKDYVDTGDTAAKARANHTGTQTSATISDLTEAVQDIVGAAIVAGANVTKTYDDAAGTITINSTASGGSTAPDATTAIKGIVQLAGDLGGTAASPTVPTKVSKSGDTMTGTLNFANFDQAYVPETNLLNKQLPGSVLSNSVSGGPFKDMWHDHLAFSRSVGAPTFEQSTDKTNWTTGTLNTALFNQKQSQSVTVLDTATHLGARWTWNSPNFQYSNVRWLVLGTAYNGVQPVVTVVVESSADGTSWTTRHTSSFQTPGVPYWLKISDFGGDPRIRVTLTAAASNTGVLRLAAIKMMTFRWGDQGGGSEFETPFDWDGDRNITFVRAYSSNAAAGATELIRKGEVDTALALKANAANPVFTGTVTIPDGALAIADTAGLQLALDAKASRSLTKNSISASYTLVAADAVDVVLHSTSATGITITLPQDTAATIAQEVAIPWRQYGAGQLTFAAGTGATLISRGSAFKSAGQYAEGLLTKVAANTWLLSGDIVP